MDSLYSIINANDLKKNIKIQLSNIKSECEITKYESDEGRCVCEGPISCHCDLLTN